MKCPGCGHENPDKVGFGTVCEKCLAWLHTCDCCRLHNRESGRCRSSTTEYSGPSDVRNFCDEFTLGSSENGQSAASDAAARFDKLFDPGRSGG